MLTRRGSIALVAAVLWWGALPTSAQALIEALTPLSDFIEQADAIVVAKVERLDRERVVAVLAVSESLKGKPPAERMVVNLAGDKKAETSQLLDRLDTDLPLVLFITAREKKPVIVLAYSNGTWLQIVGKRQDDAVRWGFTRLEIYLRRTFSGSTDALKSTLADAISGKQQPPAVNPKEKPGIGPVVERATSPP